MSYTSLLTVTAPAADYMLVGLATAKDELGITVSTTDARITRWILEAGAAIQGAIGGRVLRAEGVTELFRARGNYNFYDAPGEHFHPRTALGQFHEAVPGLRMRRYPIVSVGSIVEDETTTLVAGTDYEVDGEAGIIYRLNAGFRIGWYARQILVTYVGGYVAVADVPLDIQTAVMLMLRYRRGAQTRDPTLRQRTVPGVLEEQYQVAASVESTALPSDVEGYICRFRDVHM